MKKKERQNENKKYSNIIIYSYDTPKMYINQKNTIPKNIFLINSPFIRNL